MVAILRALVLLALASAPLSTQGGGKQNGMTGYVDPTVATFNGNKPMVACASACGASLVNQNTDALQAAIDQAAGSSHPWVYLPPGQYPIARGGVSHNQIYGVQLAGYSGVVIMGYGAVLRGTGDLGIGSYVMMRLTAGTSNVRIYGLTFSQRDLTHSPIPEQTHMLQLGDGNTAVDNVQVVNCAFIEGQGGDGLRFLGGNDDAHLISRVAVANNYIDGKRAGVSYQHGTNEIDIYGNWFGPNGTDQFLDHESTSDPANKNENVVGNMFVRAPQPVQTVTLSGHSEVDGGTSDNNVFAYNVVTGSVQAINIRRTWLVGNMIDDIDTNNDPGVYFFRVVDDTWIVDNWIRQKETGAASAQCVELQNNLGFAPTSAWLRGNRCQMYTCVSSCGGFGLQPVREFWVSENTITYHASTADAGANGFIGVVATSENTIYGDNTPAQSSGWIVENRMRRDVQSDGVTQAGRPFAGIDYSSGSQPAIGHATLRDNFIDGAKDAYFMLQTQLTEGPPLISGNVITSVAAENLPSSWLSESTDGGETVTSGALSPSMYVSFLTTTGTASYTLADCVRDGVVHHVKVTAATGTPNGMLTPAHFGDGTSLSWTGLAEADLVCDAGTYRLLGSTGMTVNP